MPRPSSTEAAGYKDEAMRRVLAAVDSNPGAYVTRDGRTRLFNDVIGEHQLWELYGAGQKNEELRIFTPTRLARVASDAAKDPGGTTLDAVLHRGSAALRAEYLTRLQYAAPLPGGNGANTGITQAGAAPGAPKAAAAASSAKPSSASNSARTKPKAQAKAAQVVILDETPESEDKAEVPTKTKKRKSTESGNDGSKDQQPKRARLETTAKSTTTATAKSKPSSSRPHSPQEQQIRKPSGTGTVQSGGSEHRKTDVIPAATSRPQPSGTEKATVDPEIGPSSTQRSSMQPKRDEAAAPGKRRREGVEIEDDRPPKSPRVAAPETQVAKQPASPGKRGYDQVDSAASPARPQKAPRTVPPIAPKRKERPFAETSQLQPTWVHVNRLSGEEIQEKLNRMWYKTVTFANQVVAETGVDDKKKAEWVMRPEQDLEDLYTSVLGDEWRTQARTLNQLKTTRSRELMQILTAGAVNELVLKQPVPWPGPQEVLAQYAGMKEIWNDVLMRYTSFAGAIIENVAWQVNYAKIKSQAFWDETIQPLGKNLAEVLWKTIEPQLAALGAVEPVKAICGPEQWFEERIEDLTYIFSHAILVRGLMKAAPDKYTVSWLTPGTEWDIDEMRAERVSDRPKEVAFCVSPLVKVSWFERPDEWKVAARAWVYTRPLPEPKVGDT